MISKTTTRPPPRSSQSHSQSHSQANRNASKTTTPAGPPPRNAASVGQPFPPHINEHLRTPSAIQEEVRTPSPNYFGLAVNPIAESRDSGVVHGNNWSPPTSSIQSFGVNTPQHIPLDSNPEFALFRRQTEEGGSFSLGHGNLSHFASTPGTNVRPKERKQPARTETSENPPSPKSGPSVRDETPDRMDVDNPRDQLSSRQSLGAPSFFDIPRQQSPVSITPLRSVQRNVVSNLDDRHPRLSLPQNKADPPSPHLNHRTSHQRADTLPPSLEDGPVMIAPSQLKHMLDEFPSSEYLLLDLRVFPQFSSSRIQGALNLCIPTTLLKRPSFNLKKLQDTFGSEAEKAKFSGWINAKYIIVYDAFSDEKRDAVSAINTFKKFTNEGWEGHNYIVRGGFAAFSKEFPQLIDTRSSQAVQSSKVNLSLTGPGAPVAGGCAMPATKNAANPFFSNIRQNQDLIGGVGLIAVKVPEDLAIGGQSILPSWLLEASAKENKGHNVADKFYKIEVEEQSRMTKALASGVSYGTPNPGSRDFQIAGIEKGGKNRYNNIWPFEHARVRLQGRPEGSCDYVNASHVKASRSNKQYIASQGPLPATFDDFWSVIWDHDVRVIVMLTAESEGGQLKCHPYWSSREYGPLKLKVLSEKKVSLDTKRQRTSSTDQRDSGRRRAATTVDTSPILHATLPAVEAPYAVVRKFTLAHSSHPFSPIREITQIHYSSWPDFGAPASPAHLLGLVELSNSLQKASAAPTQSTRSDAPENVENPRPVLVHCSAGCGRTGTFCTIDSVIDMLKRQRKETKSGVTPMEGVSSRDDYMGQRREPSSAEGDWVFNQNIDLVEKTVEEFRKQRLSMVQNLQQFVLCYETVLEWIAQQKVGTTTTRERSGSDARLGRRSS